MSQTSLILLSESAEPEMLVAALDRAQDGERLLIVPAALQPYVGSEPALNISQPNRAFSEQLIDRAMAALRPQIIIADLQSLQLLTPNLRRYPQLKTAIIMSDGSEKKKHLRAQAACFNNARIIGRS